MKQFLISSRVAVFTLILCTLFFASCKKNTPAEAPIVLTVVPASQSVYYNESASITVSALYADRVSAISNGIALTINNGTITLPHLKQSTDIEVMASAAGKESVKKTVTITVFGEINSAISKNNYIWVNALSTKRILPNGSLTSDATVCQPTRFFPEGTCRIYGSQCGSADGNGGYSIQKLPSGVLTILWAQFPGDTPYTLTYWSENKIVRSKTDAGVEYTQTFTPQ